MKKLLGLFILASVLLTIGFASAVECTSQTVVSGTIYKDVITNGVVGANVEVTCNGYTETTTSVAGGAYSVVFDCSECAYEDEVAVVAQKDALTGDNSGEVDMQWSVIGCGINLDVGIVNVPLVPEFGVVVGVLTALGALGAFFIVRRK